MSPRNRQILRLAVPSIVSNITVPLLGLVDVAIVGHIGDAAYIGAIAVGSMVFNILYWLFGFLRMGTSGLTSQALGRRDAPGVVNSLLRSLRLKRKKNKKIYPHFLVVSKKSITFALAFDN